MAETYMEPDGVRKIADRFDTAADILKGVSMVLQAQMIILRTTAFIGMVGGVAVERYIANIKPKIDQLAAICEENAQDLRTAAQLYEEATQRG